MSSPENTRPIEEHLQVIPSELEKKDRTVGRRKDAARIKRRHLEVRSRENEKRK
ncbi:hypothetical protein Gotur_022631 [Gossypium turneri]